MLSLTNALIRYSLLVLLIFLSYNFFIDNEDLVYLSSIPLTVLFYLVILQLLFFYFAGVQYSFIIEKNSKLSISHFEKISLPTVMTFWSFIIPIQGSLIYLSAYLSKVYNVKVKQSIAFVIFLLSLNLSLFGALFLFIFVKISNISFSLVSIGMILNFLIIKLVNYALTKINTLPIILNHIHEVIKSILSFYTVSLDFLLIFVANLIQLSLIIMKFWLCAQIINLDISLFSLLVLSFITRFSVVLKLTPGNIGVDELLSGIFFSFLSYSSSEAILLTVMGRIPQILVCFFFGILNFNSDFNMITNYNKKNKK